MERGTALEIKVKKEKEPELKLKKEAQVLVHKKNPLLSKKEEKSVFTSRPAADILGRQKKKGTQPMEREEQPKKKRVELYEKETGIKKQAVKEAVQKGQMEDGKKRNAAVVSEPLPVESIGQKVEENSQTLAVTRAKEQYRREQAVKQAAAKKPPIAQQTVIRGVRQGEAAILTQLDGGEEVNDSLYVMETAAKPAEKLWDNRNYKKAEQELKIKQADGKITNKQFYKETKAVKKKQLEKQKKQAVRQRKLQYMINKLTGNGQQDSLVQVAKDVVKMKASVFMLKVVQFAGALLVPLFSILLVVAIPVVIVFFLLYCSPLGAFMPNPSEENPTVREVLSGYYMDFNTSLGQNGQDGSVTYLHHKDGNYVSNYYDTLMVYMVKYDTGDMGIDMDEKHKKKLKEIFDEMNSFENTTITTTIRAGESLGNVVTSGYCQCSICCGQWAGGPTASGVMPQPEHTLAVDAQNPFVPMGTKIIMNGIEYTVEDTGAFDRYGVQFDVFCANHATASAWGHQTFEAFLADGDENEITVTKEGAYVKNLNYEDYIALGKLTKKEEELLREVMSEEFRNEIPSFGVGSDVANLALTKVGCKYSQEHRYEEGYYDCSSLVQRLYQEVGISLPGIASTQGEFMVNNGLEVTEGELEPGDLIFYSYEQNGQFRNISHVAIYIGNGRMVHAANSSRGVVNDPFRPSNINLYGRPSRLQ